MSREPERPEDPGAGESSALRHRAQEILRELVGRPDARLRPDQWRAIKALVVGRRRTLVVQRTGWGKSAVYFVATALLRHGWAGRCDDDRRGAHAKRRGAGATVIISPLLALMRDQVAAARRAGIRAVTINSANAALWPGIEEQVRTGEVDVLLVSPERLNNPVFRDEVLPHLAADAGLVVIDEAHCISDWGHDFRPDYRRIRRLLSELEPATPVLATTATANARVTADIAEQLAEATDRQGVLVLRGSLARDSLHLGVRSLPDAATRLAWLTAYLRGAAGSGIVYCLTVTAAQDVAAHLGRAGLDVAVYTGRTDTSERERLEADLKADRVKALVATSALGMGFDKPDLAFVVHVGAPASPVAYYQQVGRAGRGVARAEVILLPGSEDRAIWEWFGSQGFPAQEQVRRVLAELDEAGLNDDGPRSSAVLEAVTGLRRTRLESMLKVLDVDGAVRRVRGGWVSTGREWSYDAERYRRVEAARVAEQESMLAYEALEAPACRMAFLRTELDDPEMTSPWRCGRCDLCGGLSPGAAVDAREIEAARTALSRTGVMIEPRRQWPVGMARLGAPEWSGRIAVHERASTGMAVGRLDGLGLSTALRRLVAAGADAQVPPQLREPVAEALRQLEELIDQDDGEAPGGTVVVLVDSRTRPRLARQLGNAVARLLQAPPLGVVSVSGRPGRHDVGSAFRLAEVSARLSIGEWTAPQLSRLKGARVILVDDWTDSGWTLTVAAALLRRAGAAQVRPFVLAQR